MLFEKWCWQFSLVGMAFPFRFSPRYTALFDGISEKLNHNMRCEWICDNNNNNLNAHFAHKFLANCLYSSQWRHTLSRTGCWVFRWPTTESYILNFRLGAFECTKFTAPSDLLIHNYITISIYECGTFGFMFMLWELYARLCNAIHMELWKCYAVLCECAICGHSRNSGAIHQNLPMIFLFRSLYMPRGSVCAAPT